MSDTNDDSVNNYIKVIRIQCQFIFLGGKPYSLCQNNSISKNLVSKFSYKYSTGFLFS